MFEKFGECTVCHTTGPLHHLELFVIGSEGEYLCPSCRLSLTEVLSQMKYMASRARKEMAIRMKKEYRAREAKDVP